VTYTPGLRRAGGGKERRQKEDFKNDAKYVHRSYKKLHVNKESFVVRVAYEPWSLSSRDLSLACSLARSLSLCGFFPWDGRSPVPHRKCDIPFPPRCTGRYRKRTISARPSYQGVRRSVWDPETSALGRRLEGAARWLVRTDGCLSPPVPARRATWPNGEWG